MFQTCDQCEYESTAKTTLNQHIDEKGKYECDNSKC